MLWFLTLTQSCNLHCIYCGSGDTFEIEDLSPYPREMTYNLADVSAIARDKDPIICFYGGEPLLKMKLFSKVMDMVSHAKFCLQTNATLLNRLPTNILLKIDTILCSVDGDADETDRNRGDGSYQTVIDNALDARDRGYEGDLVARMTVSDGCDVYTDVAHLLEAGDGVFSHVHWQLDVLWDSPIFARWNGFLEWRDTSYNPGITKLTDLFRTTLVNEKRVLGIAPFLGVLWSLLNDEKIVRIRCGSGSSSFNIATDGRITACPIAPEIEPVGELTSDFDPDSIIDSVLIGGRCEGCEVLDKCGGRCLYANKTDWWGDDGFDAVCVTVKHLIDEMQRILPDVKKAIDEGMNKEMFHYPPFNNSVEVIP